MNCSANSISRRSKAIRLNSMPRAIYLIAWADMRNRLIASIKPTIRCNRSSTKPRSASLCNFRTSVTTSLRPVCAKNMRRNCNASAPILHSLDSCYCSSLWLSLPTMCAARVALMPACAEWKCAFAMRRISCCNAKMPSRLPCNAT